MKCILASVSNPLPNGLRKLFREKSQNVWETDYEQSISYRTPYFSKIPTIPPAEVNRKGECFE